MLEVGSFKRNSKLEIDGFPYTVVDFQHVKPGKGSAFTRCKLRNLITGQQLERTFKSGDRFPIPDISAKDMQYLYAEGDLLTFMDTSDYEQITIDASTLGDSRKFLVDNMECAVLFYNNKPINVELQNFVELPIEYCEPGFKGDTAQGGTKPATLAGGHTVTVPLYLNQGDILKIDTRTGEYVEKVSK
ncbi:elongation factor P [bacterium]|nr:elongation factor P [bacterium]